MKKVRAVIALLITAVFCGGLVGAFTALFLRFIDLAQRLIWEDWTVHLPYQSLILCTLGGVLVGLGQRFLGDHPKETLSEAVTQLIKTGRMEYKHLPRSLTNISASLIFGASLGPEAAIVDILGGMGTWVGDLLKRIKKKFQIEPVAEGQSRLHKILSNWPGWLAVLAGGFAFSKLLGGLYSSGLLHAETSFAWTDLLWAIPFGLLGAAGGELFLSLQKWLAKWKQPLQAKPILTGVTSGFLLGFTSLFLPQILFSGQHVLQPTYNTAFQLGFWALLLIALMRFLFTNVLLVSGWKGGQFLPIIFGGASLGMAFGTLFPSIPFSVTALASIAGLLAIVLPNPLIALLVVIPLFPIQYAGIFVVAVLVITLLQRMYRHVRASKSSPDEQTNSALLNK
ncbi:MAG: chloride channel protein [Anaerolineaceae bacterium]|nr:chloride channel protein [Anaerolineaceae bacterium]